MSWSITDTFPSWGETGEMPPDGFFYQGQDKVNEKHLDALWNGINLLENETRTALQDIDSDQDGVVDEADTANLYKGNDIDSDGDGIVDHADLATDANNLGNLPPSRYVKKDQGAVVPQYQSVSDVPSTISTGELVYIDDDNGIYIETVDDGLKQVGEYNTTINVNGRLKVDTTQNSDTTYNLEDILTTDINVNGTQEGTFSQQNDADYNIDASTSSTGSLDVAVFTDTNTSQGGGSNSYSYSPNISVSGDDYYLRAWAFGDEGGFDGGTEGGSISINGGSVTGTGDASSGSVSSVSSFDVNYSQTMGVYEHGIVLVAADSTSSLQINSVTQS